jgi:hypothetical protein
MDDERDRRIRDVAYFLWREEGCPDGRAEAHWTTAEAVVDAQDGERRETERLVKAYANPTPPAKKPAWPLVLHCA